jgi:hypothetical protein
MRTKTIAILGVALALGACGKTGGGEGNSAAAAAGSGNASATASTSGSGAASSATAGAKLRPGLYENTIQTSVTGLPPQIAKAMMDHKVTSRSCVTPQEASRPSGELFGGQQAQGCTTKDLAYEGGRIHGTMTCVPTAERKSAMTFTMDGTYGGESFDVRTRVETNVEGHSMVMEGRTIARRVGDCPADGKEG